MNRRHFMQTGLGMAGAALFSPAVFGQQANELIFMTPTSMSLAWSPELHADTGGFYERNGVKVRVEVGRGAAQSLQLVAGNQIQVGRTAGNAYMAARAQGNSDVIAFGTIAQRSPFRLVSAAAAPLRNVNDLEGKVIGMPSFGGTVELGLNLMLAKAGIDPAKVRRERTADGPASFGLIQAGRLHGFFANVSSVVRLQAENLPIHLMDIDDDVPANVYVTREANLQATPDAYIAFTRSVIQSVRDLITMDDAALLQALARMRTKYDVPGLAKLDVALKEIRATQPLWTMHGLDKVVHNNEAQWEASRQLLERMDLIKPTTRAMYTNDIWNRAMQ